MKEMMRQFLVTTSWDDGALSDIKLAKLLKKYDIPATFYTPLNNGEREVLSASEIIKLSKDFEIGAHGVTHTRLNSMGDKQAEQEIVECKRFLEQLLGKETVSFCYPQGGVNTTIKQLVGKAGFRYARTTSLFATTVGDKLLAPATIHAYDHNPFVYIQHGATRKLFYFLLKQYSRDIGWDNLATEALEYCIRNRGVFHLWGHSWEIEEKGDWAKLERIFAYIAKRTKKSDRVTNKEMIKRLEEQKKVYYGSLRPEQYQATYETRYYRKEQKILRDLVKDFDIVGKKVLDIGCGTGRVSALFNHADYTGIDFAVNLIAYAKKKWKKTNRVFIVGKFDDLEKETLGKFDLILIWGLFEDEVNPFKKITILEKYLNERGRIIFTLHNAGNQIFNLAQEVKTEILDTNFPYTSFTYDFMKRWAEEYARDEGWNCKIETFGLLPPFNKYVPALNSSTLGATIIVILDK